FRHSMYRGSEYSDAPAEYFALSAAGIEHPIASFVPHTQYDILTMHRIANTRGWFLLDMMSREIGRARFARTLPGIAAKYADSALSFTDFRREVGQGAQRDISWFFDDWFDRTGAPEYTLTWHPTAHGVVGSIHQSAPAYRATVPIELRGNHGERLQVNVWVG